MNQLLQSTNEDFVEWITEKPLVDGEKHVLKELFQDFRSTYYGDDSSLKQRTFSNWLKIWAGKMKLEIKKTKSNGEQYITAVTK